ncbi:hypothetical protein GGR57DRAFT_95865 [Xylariaceae sp. FL1272]|nr:hypothetical protein GGR57DRAFT_95865 [Xylariaceae sp. FL1272]
MSIITTPRLQTLWKDAQEHMEWATTRLWEHIFNRLVFTEENWVVSSQQPPTHEPSDRRRVDLVVEQIDEQGRKVGTLLFVEAKRANASITEIQEAEYQAFTAACAYHIETNVKSLWAMTCVGSKARIWIFSERIDYLMPYVPQGDELSAIHEYLEISTHGEDLVRALRFCKNNMQPPQQLVAAVSASPRPQNVILQGPWHDAEVAMVDAQRRF